MSNLSTKVDPGQSAYVITPDDDNDLAHDTRAIWVGSSGSITCTFINDEDSVVIDAINSGTLLPFQLKKVFATGTDADLIIAIR